MDRSGNETIPDYWLDKGLNTEVLDRWYTVLSILVISLIILAIANYFFTWLVRRRISPLKLIGEAPLSKLETYAQACKLGQEPTINFVSSVLITNDRVYIVMRLIVAIWSLFLTYATLEWEGIRVIVAGLYYPTVVSLTIYINFNRELIVDGFGKKAQMINKFLSFLFNVTTAMDLLVGIFWWTKCFGAGLRYRDMPRPLPILNPIVIFNKEFAPILFMLVELLWFDTTVFYAGFWGPIIAGNLSSLAIINGRSRKELPQALAVPLTHPASSLVRLFVFTLIYPLLHAALATFCFLKTVVFKKIPTLAARLEIRQKCVANFRKRQAFDRYFNTRGKEGRRSAAAKEAYKNLGRASYRESRRTVTREL
ncbi:Oidioi.mRNA.OKI2018_I69.PAR.g9089.t1.cds [Oikopleura dioica]|uniref:Oidioi.mRNA.OKI2018_I69.PAR.g9089.t1.cds n=1 Tax=Oikopleura dioica TaxID=34765 RepID=A0ABN7RIY6_OIKDI|nr:Oidioi.mRNA.OKI2018_I69.PAR.g9089.t1.cds [Oikopleura dioica]